jgi:hypothetical protein
MPQPGMSIAIDTEHRVWCDNYLNSIWFLLPIHVFNTPGLDNYLSLHGTIAGKTKPKLPAQVNTWAKQLGRQYMEHKAALDWPSTNKKALQNLHKHGIGPYDQMQNLSQNRQLHFSRKTGRTNVYNCLGSQRLNNLQDPDFSFTSL